MTELTKATMVPGMVYQLSDGGTPFKVISVQPINLLRGTDHLVCGTRPSEEGLVSLDIWGSGSTYPVDVLGDLRITMDKQYQTRSGLPVKVLSTSVNADRCVVAIVQKPGYEVVELYYADGSQYLTTEDSYDLVEVLPVTFEPDEVVEVLIGGEWVKHYYQGVFGDDHAVWMGGRSSKTALDSNDQYVILAEHIRKLAE